MDAEFGYELLICRWAELAWPPEEPNRPVVVSRQLGTQKRRWDTLVLEVDPEAFAQRRRFGDRELDSDLLHVVRHAPADWQFYRDALPHPGYPWRYVRPAIHRAAARDVVEKRKRNGRIEIRRLRPYPDWVDRIVAIENKPDLDASAARALADQLSHDVDRALADEVWVATEATGDRIEPALLEDIPVEVGILATDVVDDEPTGAADVTAAVDCDSATVEWYPSALSATVRSDAEGNDTNDADTDATTDADDRERRRLEIAERAYGKGWRSFHETMRPDCRSFELRRSGDALVPFCTAKGRVPTGAECAGSCAEFSPEPPSWRTRGWPIEGGPGKGVQWLLDKRRSRVREDATED